MDLLKRTLLARFPGAHVILTPGNGYTQNAMAVPSGKAVGLRVAVYLRDPDSPDVIETHVDLPVLVSIVEQMWANA